MSDKKEKKIKIAEAKGRPMLRWVGKAPLDYVKGFPAQLVEHFDPSGNSVPIENPVYDKMNNNWQNLLFLGDNKEVLGNLLENGFRGTIDFVYIDPPFDSNANYVRKVELRGFKEKSQLKGEELSLGEQIQYHDIWANDNYLQFMYERLLLIRELLKSDGVIALHCDWRKSHHLRLVLDEVFGPDNFINEITIKMSNPKNDAKNTYGIMTEKLLIYSKGENYFFKILRTDFDDDYIKSEYKYEDKKGKYATSPLTSRQPTDPFYEWKGVSHRWRVAIDTMRDLEKSDLLHYTDGNIPRKKRYLEENSGKIVQDYWDDIGNYQTAEYSDYPTAKPIELLMRLINTFTKNESNIVLDCFIGSGTTAAASQRIGRRWIGVDINKGSIQTTSKRLQRIISEQFEKEKGKKSTNNYLFNIYNVNNYDLQLLRTEAIELAIQHIGVQRIKTDSFFEGILGRNLVKMIDFNHPLTLLDIQLIQDELKKRPEENRNITIVCLGKELAIDPFIEDYNKKHPVNKFEIIELRTDKKYGKFLIHKPIEAKINFQRKENKATIEIKDFISPSILERLNDSDRLVKVKISDFRSMIDVVLIDNDYNGNVFNIKYSDVPQKRSDFIQGKYEIELPAKKTTIAVKIIDMLGEEVLITNEI
jgi:adenine-specific DNA-methyltransferase